jgi:hypothetical protein
VANEESNMDKVLIVADRVEPCTGLANAVRRRAAEGRCAFTLLVPAVAHGLHRVVDPEDACCEEAEATIERLLPALEEAAGSRVVSRIGSHEVLAAVEDAVNSEHFGEAIVCTAPSRMARWLHVDLARKVAGLGLAVTTVPAATAVAA